METTDNSVKVLGNDHAIYEIADFVAQGKTCEDAIGIVFNTPIIGSRVLAFPNWRERWGETDVLLTTELDEAFAVQILCGLDDSMRIYETQKDYDKPTAITLCMEYQRGDLQWYLPSLMELGALYLLRDKINTAMSALKCDESNLLTKDDNYWACSESGDYGAWNVDFYIGRFYNTYKCCSYVVRAVAQLPADF